MVIQTYRARAAFLSAAASSGTKSEGIAMDMLIKLYNLLPATAGPGACGDASVAVRRAMAYERSSVVQWVQRTFNTRWADECAVAFGHAPIGCFIAICAGELSGFCCMNSTFINYIGPIGVHEKCRRKGVGRQLVRVVLNALWCDGYAYAIVGDVGEPAFFKAVAGAIEIPDSTPGSYPARMQTP